MPTTPKSNLWRVRAGPAVPSACTNAAGFAASRDDGCMWMATSFSRRRWRLAFLAACLLLAVWSVLVEPRWIAAREIEHAVPQWQGAPGLKVAVASDWHFSKRPLWRVTTVA